MRHLRETSRLIGKQSPRATTLAVTLALLLTLFLVLGVAFSRQSPAYAQGSPLHVEIVAGYNLVVDSNATSVSTYAPSVATVMGRFCNTGSSTLTNVYGYIGDGTTPGTYPARDSSDPVFIAQHPALANTGLYAFSHVGGRIGAADATRSIGTIPAGECRVQYWHFTYPQCSESDRTPPCSALATWGDSVKPDDDLWLEFNVWGSSDQGGGSAIWRMTMRNEISAMANKIKPHPDGEWFSTRDPVVEPGGLITSNGIFYELGTINQGFDNDNDSDPDYNAWMQPIGESSYDPSCFRLVRTSSLITVSRSGGDDDLVIRTDDLNPDPNYGGPLYYTNLPSNNTGTRGEVFYTFQALNGPCSTALTPYQEVASGFDNEKFNGDYGIGIPPVGSYAPKVAIDKSANPNVISLGGTTTYRIPFANSGTSDAGLGLSSGGSTPLVVSDTVPSGMQYVGGSATYNLTYSPNIGVTRRFSTDSGRTWSTADPGNATSSAPDSLVVIQWWLNDALPAGSSGSYAEFQATAPGGYTGSPFTDNCADARFGVSAPFDRACATVMIQGGNSIGDYVWRDENRNGLKDDGNTGISGVKVSLYWDRTNNGFTDDDLLITSQDTLGASEGNYLFSQLPDGNYVVKVDTADSDIPVGYYATTSALLDVDVSGGTSYLDADFGFGPSLGFDKQLISGDPAYEGDDVIFHIEVTNNRPGDGNPPGPCQYTVWATTYTNGASSKAWLNPENIVPAPNGLYAIAPYKNSEESIAVTTWNLGSTPAGTIQKVEALVPMLAYPPLAGTFQVQVARGANIYDHLYDAATLADGTMAVNVTNDNPSGGASGWAWSDFTGGSTSTSVNLIGKKAGNPGGRVEVDAVGYRITANQTCGNPSDTMNPVPLTDAYDPTKLQFLSARPPATAVAGGTITWANVGPVYGGQTREIIVRFRALQPPDSDSDGEPDPITHQNCAATAGAVFADGTPANSASDCVPHDINPAGTIGDMVWADNDNSGGPTMTAGDLGLRNVTVRLYDCGPNGTCEGGTGDDILVQTTNTDYTGWYLFRGVRDINRPYQVVVDTATLPGGAAVWTCTYDDLVPFNSLSGPITINYDDGSSLFDDYLGADFSYRYSGQYLVGTIWHDRNNSAAPPPPDSGEEWLAAVTVKACRSSNCQSSCTSLTTDANGYFFTTLSLAATYYVCVDAASGPLGTGTWAQTWDTDGLATLNQATVVVPAGSFSRADFSYRRTDTIQLGDTIYVDWNDDGQQGDGNPANGNEGEEGISGVTARLYLDDGDGVYEPGVDVLWQTTATNASGWYNFNVTPGGDYLVVLDQATIPAGYKQTQDPDEPGVCTTCNGYSDVQSQAATDLTQDFGFRPVGTGSIGDFVWRDLDHDGIQDGGSETGIANITVNLYEDMNGNGVIDAGDALVKTTSTGADGEYLFSGLYTGTDLNPARYLVDVDTTDPQLPLDGSGQRYILSTNNDPHLVMLTLAGPTYVDADFGFTPGGVIGDYVWQDTDADGLQDEGEPPIAGVVVNLYVDVNGDGYWDAGDAYYATDTTGANGLYEFTSLPAGNYVVWIDPSNFQSGGTLANFSLTYDPDGYTPGASYPPCGGSSVDCDNQSGVSLAPGQVDRSQDYGYRPLGVIGDYVWMDLDGDGVQDVDELGIGGVTVWLYSGVTLVGTTQTNVYGYYSFVNRAAGTYTVRIDPTTLPAGVAQTYDPDGTLDSQTTVTLPAGGSILTADFGYRGTNSVSGSAYRDLNDNAVQDVGETTTYPGVTIYLWYCGADNVCGSGDDKFYASMQSDANGDYSFTHLPDGRYRVSVDAGSPPVEDFHPTKVSSPTVFREVDLDQAKADPNPVNRPDQDFGFYDPTPTAVTLASFTAVVQDNAILLTWETASEVNTLGFNLYRAESPDGPLARFNADLIRSQYSEAPIGGVYTSLDETVVAGITYYYWLEEVDIYGATSRYGPVAAQVSAMHPEMPYHVFLPVVNK
jgi:uncharacterized repeat protein (TIGR01451 family)